MIKRSVAGILSSSFCSFFNYRDRVDYTSLKGTTLLGKLICIITIIYLGIKLISIVNALPFNVVDDNGKEMAIIELIPQKGTHYINISDLRSILDPDLKQQYIFPF